MHKHKNVQFNVRKAKGMIYVIGWPNDCNWDESSPHLKKTGVIDWDTKTQQLKIDSCFYRETKSGCNSGTVTDFFKLMHLYTMQDQKPVDLVGYI